jgi:hypothetical protein
MKLDDHPQYQKEGYGASAQQAGFQKIKDKESGGPGVGKVRSDDEIKKEKGGQAFLDRIAKAKAKMNKEEVEVDEAMSNYDRARKRAAQRAAERNAARAAGKTGVVPGVGYVSPRKERETYVDSAGTTRHKSGAKMEEVEVDEAMRPGPRREKMRAKMHDPYVRGGSKSRGQAHNIAVRGDVSTGDPAIKSRGGGGVKKDKGMGYGDRGAGNKARRRMGQEPLRGTRTEEASMSPQELMLQKKKARIDKMIAMKRQQGLAKQKAGAEQPAKAMGEAMDCAHNPQGKDCPVHGKKECPSLEKIDERTRFAKETGKDFKTGNPSEKGGTRTGKSAFDQVSRQMRKTGGVMSSRGKGIQPQGKKKEKGAKGYKGVTPVDKIRNRLSQKRAAKPNPYRARAGESD